MEKNPSLIAVIVLIGLLACQVYSQNIPVKNTCAMNNCWTGTCQDLPNGFSMCVDCALGYTGTSCEKPPVQCNNKNCNFRGSCQIAVDPSNQNAFIANCVCSPGYDGDDCENDINECLVPSTIVCLNGGTCLNNVNQWLCQCPAGFGGDKCQNNVRDCSIMPCLNGATCTDLPISNTYTCACLAGWTGQDCDERALCDAGPCGLHGGCKPVGASYVCQCYYGWTGTHCDSIDTATVCPSNLANKYIFNMCDKPMVYNTKAESWVYLVLPSNNEGTQAKACECVIIGMNTIVRLSEGSRRTTSCTTLLKWSRWTGFRRRTDGLQGSAIDMGICTSENFNNTIPRIESRDVIRATRSLDPNASVCIHVKSYHSAIWCNEVDE